MSCSITAHEYYTGVEKIPATENPALSHSPANTCRTERTRVIVTNSLPSSALSAGSLVMSLLHKTVRRLLLIHSEASQDPTTFPMYPS